MYTRDMYLLILMHISKLNIHRVMQSTTAVLHLLCALTLLHCSATAGVIRDDTTYTSAGIKVQQSVPTRPNVSEIFLTWVSMSIQ